MAQAACGASSKSLLGLIVLAAADGTKLEFKQAAMIAQSAAAEAVAVAGERTVHAGAARVARRLFCRLARLGRQRHHPLAPQDAAALLAGAASRRSRRGRRRALARSDHAACRAHEARRRQAAAAAHDGGDGPAGLRPVRLQLPGLRRRDLFQEGRQAQSVHSGRQGNAAHAESSLRRTAAPRLHSLRRRKRRLPRAITANRAASAARATIRPKRFLCRAPCSTSPARTSKPGTSSSIFRQAGSITSSATASAFTRPTIRRWSHAVIKALGVPASFPTKGARCATCSPTDVSLGLAPDALFQLYSYITGGERRQKGQGAVLRARIPTATPRRSTCSRRSRNSPALRPDPEAFVEALEPLQPRLFSISSSIKSSPGRVALTVDAVRYQIGKRMRLGVASTFLADRVAPGDESESLCAAVAAFRPAGGSRRRRSS